MKEPKNELLHINNICFVSGQVPTELKEYKVIPMHNSQKYSTTVWQVPQVPWNCESHSSKKQSRSSYYIFLMKMLNIFPFYSKKIFLTYITNYYYSSCMLNFFFLCFVDKSYYRYRAFQQKLDPLCKSETNVLSIISKNTSFLIFTETNFDIEIIPKISPSCVHQLPHLFF